MRARQARKLSLVNRAPPSGVPTHPTSPLSPPSYTALGAVGCSLSPGHHQYIPCLFCCCFGKHPTSWLPHIFQSAEDEEDVFPMHRDRPLPFCTITSHYRLDFRVLDSTCAMAGGPFAQQTPLGGIVRIQPVLWFCDKHRQGRRSLPYPSPVSCSGTTRPVGVSELLRKTS